MSLCKWRLWLTAQAMKCLSMDIWACKWWIWTDRLSKPLPRRRALGFWRNEMPRKMERKKKKHGANCLRFACTCARLLRSSPCSLGKPGFFFLVSMYISVLSFLLWLSLSQSPLLLGCFTFSSVAEAGLGKQTVWMKQQGVSDAIKVLKNACPVVESLPPWRFQSPIFYLFLSIFPAIFVGIKRVVLLFTSFHSVMPKIAW